MISQQLNLKKPQHAYMYGFMQADGHLSADRGRRGKLTVELAQRDEWILERFAEIIPAYASLSRRTRDTNFKKNYKSATLRVCSRQFREELSRLGFPSGRKDECVAPPKSPFRKIDYVRGLVDANGSVGVSADGRPFISLFVRSEAMKLFMVGFLHGVTGKRKWLQPNSRDAAYNIVVFNEDAQALARMLYYSGALALPRKAKKAKQVLRWSRPAGTRRIRRQAWSPSDDALLNEVTDNARAARALGRTIQSVRLRRWRRG